MLKTAATYATFLLVVSVLYYVPFWWAFDIDVLPFFEAKDLLIGVIFPLRYSGTYFLSIYFILIVITSFFRASRFKTVSPNLEKVNQLLKELEEDDDEKKEINKEFLKKKALRIKTDIEEGERFRVSDVVVSLITFIGIVIGIYLFLEEPYEKSRGGIVALLTAQFIFLVFEMSYGLPYNLLELTNDNIRWAKVTDFFLIQFLLFLPISALTSSYSESQAILQGKKFRYVILSDLDSVLLRSSQKYAVYLGAINDRFILTDSINSEGIILDKEKLPILHVYSYDYTDTASVSRFNKAVFESKRSVKKSVATDSASNKVFRITGKK